MSIIGEIAVGVVIGGVVAAATAWASFRKFRAQTWHTRKFDLYVRAFEALHAVRIYCDMYHRFRENPEGHNKAHIFGPLSAQSTSGSYRTRHIAALGRFLLSAKATESLDKVCAMLPRPHGAKLCTPEYDEYINKLLPAVDQCLTQLANIAKKDLEPVEP